jgi:hypothetical protein
VRRGEHSRRGRRAGRLTAENRAEDGEPDLWFLPELVDVAGEVMARSGGADLVFVGRSLHAVHDLLGDELPA